MADKKISELDAITGANTAATDVFVVVDTSTGQTKKITREELNNAIEQDVLSSIDIDTINGDFTVNGNINLGDNNKAIFGAGGDLVIQHNGGDSLINDVGTGNLKIQTNGTAIELNTTGGSPLGHFTNNGDVKLFYQGSEKFATTSTGIDVTGTVTADNYLYLGSPTGSAFEARSEDSYVTLSAQARNLNYIGNRHIFLGSDLSERLRIDSSGNVGIGNSSPTYKLDVLDNSSGSVITRIKNSNAGTGARAGIFLDNDGGNLMALYATSSTYTGVSSWTDAGVISTSSTAAGGLIFNSQSSGGIKFQTSLAERMRIDSSGNVLVGKTSTSSALTTAGVDLRPEGRSFMTRSAGPSLYLSRTTSDGNIVEFYKDGTTVGSIGVDYSSRLYIGTGDTGLFFNDLSDAVQPISPAGDLRGNAIDLGTAGTTFKDLYLGGGVYLGGTGSANHLDDYEEGTWTPSYISQSGSFSSITYNEQNGTYVKIGRLVVVSFDLRTNSVSLGTASGSLYVTGLPFNINGTQGTAQCGAQQGWVTNAPEYWNPADGSNYGFLRRTNGAGYSDITVSNLTTGSSTGANRILGCSLAYYTNS